MLGIILVKSYELDENVKGYYQYYKRNKIIYINGNLGIDKQLEVCAHELGHAVIHSNLNILFLEKNTFCVKNRFEREANKFAAELLISDKTLYEYKGYTIEQVAIIEKVNKELIELKLQ